MIEVPLKKQIHKEHWMEPTAVTAERPKTDKFCEFCREDVPWHNSSCPMLKNAYKRRYDQCSYCNRKFLVGNKMKEHVTEKHAKELESLVVVPYKVRAKKTTSKTTRSRKNKA